MRFAGNASFSHNYEDETTNLSTRVRGTLSFRPTLESNSLARWIKEYLMDFNAQLHGE